MNAQKMHAPSATTNTSQNTPTTKTTSSDGQREKMPNALRQREIAKYIIVAHQVGDSIRVGSPLLQTPYCTLPLAYFPDSHSS